MYIYRTIYKVQKQSNTYCCQKVQRITRLCGVYSSNVITLNCVIIPYRHERVSYHIPVQSDTTSLGMILLSMSIFHSLQNSKCVRFCQMKKQDEAYLLLTAEVFCTAAVLWPVL